MNRIYYSCLIVGLAMLLAASQAQAALSLQGLALHFNNLRPGYVTAISVYRTQAYVAQHYHVTTTRLAYYGWLASYEAVFTRRSLGVLDEVGNKLDQYSSPAGAHWGYRVAVQNTLCCGQYHAIAAPIVGQESTAFVAGSPTRGFIGIKFREGNYVADVAILPGTKRASLLLLARVLDQRLRLYG